MSIFSIFKKAKIPQQTTIGKGSITHSDILAALPKTIWFKGLSTESKIKFRDVIQPTRQSDKLLNTETATTLIANAISYVLREERHASNNTSETANIMLNEIHNALNTMSPIQKQTNLNKILNLSTTNKKWKDYYKDPSTTPIPN